MAIVEILETFFLFFGQQQAPLSACQTYFFLENVTKDDPKALIKSFLSNLCHSLLFLLPVVGENSINLSQYKIYYL